MKQSKHICLNLPFETIDRYFRSFVRSQSMQRDLSLNLSGSQSENALKQLKTLTSPLSKLAKGMQNFGMNLDPRKIKVRFSLVM